MKDIKGKQLSISDRVAFSDVYGPMLGKVVGFCNARVRVLPQGELSQMRSVLRSPEKVIVLDRITVKDCIEIANKAGERHDARAKAVPSEREHHRMEARALACWRVADEIEKANQ